MPARLRPAAALLTALVLALAGCSIRAPQEGDWVLVPVTYDNRMDGEDGPPILIDVSYPMSLISDTAGGVWGMSSGSWLHLDAEGRTLQRFNTGPTGMITGLAAASPTVLLRAESVASTAYVSHILAFDATSGTTRQIHRDARPLGAIAVTGDVLYLVAHSLETQAMSIERMPVSGGAAPTPLVTGISEYGFSALAVARDGTMYLATERDHYTFAPDGALREKTSAVTSSPAVTVSPEGAVAWLTAASPTPGVTHFVAPGSSATSDVLDRAASCEVTSSRQGQRLQIVDDEGGSLVLPFLCAPAGFAFWRDDRLLVSVGTEGGAVLVDVHPPETSG